MSAPIRDAATLVLVRDGQDGAEVFLSRRSARAAFMANAYVYPGGRLDDADTDARLVARLRWGRPTAGWFEDEVDDLRAAGLVIAALRESFEEAGVLLARDGDGAAPDAQTLARLGEWRDRLNAGAAGFVDVLEAEGLWLDASELRYFAHWITPPFETRRFDTRFFVTPAPEGQAAAADRAELVEGEWMRPAQALARNADGTLMLAPPTLCTLEDLAAVGASVASVLAWAEAEQPVPILPQLHDVDGVPTLVLPGDPLFPSDRPARGPWRVTFAGGQTRRE
ncbi:MAG: NUDIX hydrolase [Myxococcales bacterium]|nr:NUDIX hydrolase [Myxococcales bacterium]MCB9533393.1 NUDIX hydrolase [Myxococcales bacterium]